MDREEEKLQRRSHLHGRPRYKVQEELLPYAVGRNGWLVVESSTTSFEKSDVVPDDVLI